MLKAWQARDIGQWRGLRSPRRRAFRAVAFSASIFRQMPAASSDINQASAEISGAAMRNR